MANPGLPSKVVPPSTLLALCRELRSQGKTLVFSNGHFDLLHVGHVRYLQAARALGDVLIVAVNSDRTTRQLKGEGRPLVPEEERAEILAALSCVDYVTIFDDPTAEELVAALRPSLYVKGGDYSLAAEGGGKPLPEARIVAAYGGQTIILPLVEGRSSTDLLHRMLRRSGSPPPQ